MAERPIFLPNKEGLPLYEELEVKFKWNGGFAVAQKQKNVEALHEAAKKKMLFPLLEVSTKSIEKLGCRLSAFNLKIDTPQHGKITIESAFQGSKVFKDTQQYRDIYLKSSIDAKRDPRLKESGQLVGFNYFGNEWELEPKSAFYDWLYISALYPHKKFIEDNLCKYKGFTDIEFNPIKSINCQARSCAILVSLIKRDILDLAMSSTESFIHIVYA